MFVTPRTLIMTSLLLPFSLSYYFPELFVTLGFIGHKPSIQIIFLITFGENLPSILSNEHQTRSWIGILLIVKYNPCLSSYTINNSWQVIRWSFDLCRSQTEIKETQNKAYFFSSKAGKGRIDPSGNQTKHTHGENWWWWWWYLDCGRKWKSYILFSLSPFSSFSMLKERVIERLMREILDPEPSFSRVEDGQTSDFKRASTSWNSTLQPWAFFLCSKLSLNSYREGGKLISLPVSCLPFLWNHPFNFLFCS